MKNLETPGKTGRVGRYGHFKGYILRWNSETAEKFVEKGQSSKLNPRTSHYSAQVAQVVRRPLLSH